MKGDWTELGFPPQTIPAVVLPWLWDKQNHFFLTEPIFLLRRDFNFVPTEQLVQGGIKKPLFNTFVHSIIQLKH